MARYRNSIPMVTDRRFQKDTLMKLYQEVGSVDADRLMAAALRMFPDCLDDGAIPPIWVSKGGGRAFLNAVGEYEKPAWSIGGYMLDQIGIMADGTVHPY